MLYISTRFDLDMLESDGFVKIESRTLAEASTMLATLDFASIVDDKDTALRLSALLAEQVDWGFRRISLGPRDWILVAQPSGQTFTFKLVLPQ